MPKLFRNRENQGKTWKNDENFKEFQGISRASGSERHETPAFRRLGLPSAVSSSLQVADRPLRVALGGEGRRDGREAFLLGPRLPRHLRELQSASISSLQILELALNHTENAMKCMKMHENAHLSPRFPSFRGSARPRGSAPARSPTTSPPAPPVPRPPCGAARRH